MADLSEIDLDGGSGEEGTLQGHEDELAGGGAIHSEETEESSHSRTEDLHLYYRQSLKARMGTTGLVVTVFFGLSLVMTIALLVFSYTSAGRGFLQGLKFFIF
jgi:hypothetical protein